MANTLISQGSLNRVRGSLVFPLFPLLNITAPYMSRNFISANFDEMAFVEQIETGTGFVNSPEPYVPAVIVVEILRTQALANNWFQQIQNTASIGTVEVHSDTAAFPSFPVINASVTKFDPGAFAGKDPVTKMTIRGILYVNSSMWNLS